jgi:hypothetical protein
MKIVWICPRIITETDAPRGLKPEIVTICGQEFAVFRNSSCYFQDGGVRFSRENLNGHAYFVALGDGRYTSASSARSDEAMAARLAGLPDGQLRRYIAETIDKASNPADHYAEAEAEAEAIKAQRDAERAEYLRVQEERRQRGIAAEAARIEKVAREFANGEEISWEDFEALCKRYGVVMPIQTVGSARRNVSTVRLGSMTLRRGSNPQRVHAAARELHAILNTAAVAA